MPIQSISFGTTSNPNRNDTQGVLVNCYAEDLGEENEVRYALYACDGYSSFSTLTGSGAGVCKGMLNFDDTTLYVVTGQRINRVNTSGTATDMGALATSGYAYMARNRKDPNAQIGIVTSDGLFRIIENNSVSTPSVDPDIPTFNSICALDGYFIFTAANGEWFVSSIDEGATIDELDFAQAQSNPDGILRGIVRGRDVLICGPRSIEAYQNTGATDFPFERVTAINFGVAYAPAMVNLAAVTDGGTQDVVIFPGNNADGSYAGVMMLEGYGAKTFSPSALDRAILAEPTKSSIRAFTYARNGHVFYTITGSSFTWEYNASLGRWHQRKSASSSIWNVVDAVNFNSQTIFADKTSASLYQASSSLTPGSASQIKLRHSNNGGSTWSPERSKAVGTSKTQRVRFPALGTSREDGKVFEVTFSNAIVEAGVGTDMQVITPPVHAFPRRMIFDHLYVNITSGVSQSSSAKGFVNLAVDATAVDA
jgi:hypothetical protein